MVHGPAPSTTPQGSINNVTALFTQWKVSASCILHTSSLGKKKTLLFLLQPGDQAGNYVSHGCCRAAEGTEEGEEDVSRKGGEQRAWAR